MGLKKRNKVSAEFSMSAMTDIIFLLLIFFMLTSTLVAPNALNLVLPGQPKGNVKVTSKLDDVAISAEGVYAFNGRRISLEQLEQEMANRAIASGTRTTPDGQEISGYTMTISPEEGAPVEFVVAIMDIALRNRIEAVLTAEDKEK
jgi:biopolymer transport protein ExbD